VTITFEGNDGAPIASLDDWEVHGGPAAGHHWQPGRSAYELARDWVEGDAAGLTAALLQQRPEFAGLALSRAVAEKKTQFDDNPRGPRNHDLLVEATTAEGPVVIGIEGKADETFDKPLAEWRQDPNPKSGKGARLDGLTTSFFGATLDEDPTLGTLAYQLMSALAGTLADAQRVGAVRAVLLIQEFVTDKTTDDKHKVNAAALDAFVERLAEPAGVERVGGEDAWITGPITVHGDGTRRPDALPVHVAKLVRRLRTGGAT
jgi:hypothetical protein